MRQGFPRAAPGMRIGLLGGSFDPPHAGHVHISREALKRFALDRVWWLVSPGNPLKAAGPSPMVQRLTAARALADHPRIVVTDIEARIGTRHTAETLDVMRMIYPGVRLVWLMGADNLAELHRWKHWQRIMKTVPVGVLARPGERMAARLSPAARAYRACKLRAAMAPLLAGRSAPAWCFVNLPMVDLSSTAIRNRGECAGRG